MDSLRGVAIILVVVLHAGEALRAAIGPLPGVDEVNLFLEPFRMPVLMFLSGVLLPQSLAKPGREYFAGKLSMVAWPYVLWSLILLTASGEFGLHGIVQIFYLSPTYLWYLWFILIFYVIAFPLRRVPPLALVGVGLAVSFFLPLGSRPETLAFLSAFFFLGAWCARHPERLERVLDKPWFVGAGMLAAAAVGILNVVQQDVLYRAEFSWGVVGGLLVVCWVFPRLGENPVTAGLEFVGRYSIVFYVTHLGPIMIALALADTLGVIEAWFMLPVLLLVGLGIPLGLALGYAGRKHASVNLLFELPALKSRPKEHSADSRQSQT